MLFNSLEFLAFFPIVTILYFVLPHRFRWLHLLIASCVFYAAFIPAYLLILGLTIVVDYFAGLWIEDAQGARRRALLAASIVTNVGILAVFKYYGFLGGTYTAVAGVFGHVGSFPVLDIILPIGLSFHTFQAMSYTIEVYRGHQKAERHFGIYALYVMFYPQLVAGPIERPQNLLHQFHARHVFDPQRVSLGFRLMLLGMVKKVVVADRLAVVVDRVYDNPHLHTAPALAVATVCFAFQIYADFSGYSDIAIGAAQVMGFKLMRNFDHPYVARSISEFWKRWHISLSTWFRDYVYVPLGGNRRGTWITQRNLLVTFMISGLWHGANWTFVVWGGLNGVYLVASNLTAGPRGRIADALGLRRAPRLTAVAQVGITFSLTCVAWVFFRARTVSEGANIVKTMIGGAATWLHPGEVRRALGATGLTPTELATAMAVIAGLVAFDVVAERTRGMAFFAGLPRWARWGTYYAAAGLLLVLGRFGLQQFIYFQF